MNNTLKSKAPYIALGVGGYFCIKLGIAMFSQGSSGPYPYENALNGSAAFVSNCLPSEGTLQNSANMMQLLDGRRETISVNDQDIDVINSDAFGKGSVVYWNLGPESFCQVVVEGSQENAESSLLLFLERSGPGYEKVELTRELLASLPALPNVNYVFVANSTNSAGEVLFSVTSKSTADGNFAIFTAIQQSM